MCEFLFDFGQEALEQDDFMRANWFPWSVQNMLDNGVQYGWKSTASGRQFS